MNKGFYGGGGHPKLAPGRSFQKGFTLAEVLITLGLIGIVAAMTLPSLVNNARNKQLEAAFKEKLFCFKSGVGDVSGRNR